MTETFRPVDPAVFMQRYEASQARRTGGQRGFKLKQGPPGKPVRTVLRMMPAHPNMPPDPIIEVKVHFSLGPQQNIAAPCLEPYAKDCPGCNWTEELFNRSRRASDPNTTKELKDLAFKVRGKMRFGAQIVDMAHPETGVQEFWFSDELEKKLRACFLDDQDPPQVRDLTHPTTGRDIVIEVSTKPNTDWPSYDVVRAKDTPSVLPDMEWLGQIKDLVAEHVYEPTVAEVTGALQGQRIQRGGTGGRPALQAGQAKAPAALAPAPAQPAPAPAPAPTPAAAPAPAGRKAATTKAAPVPGQAELLPPATAAAPASAAAPTPLPAAAPASRRQPAGVAAAASPNGYAGAYAWAKAEILKVFAAPRDITEQELVAMAKPPCYMEETEPTDAACQICSVLIPCYAIKNGKLAKA